MNASIYTQKDLQREARACVKGLGKLIRYEIALHDSGRNQLRVYFVRHFNPSRPVAVQAVEVTTMGL